MLTFFSNLFMSKKAETSRIGRLTYAIGDVHGRNDLLQKLIQNIRDDSANFDERPNIIFLGDYVDRGPDSNKVLDTILKLEASRWCDVEVLMGNHEHALLTFIREPEYGAVWTDFGGNSTLSSYGVTPPHLRADITGWGVARDKFIEALPDQHLDLLRRMRLTYKDGDYLFVHAGVSPEKNLEAQGADTFLWVREPFLSSKKSCDYVVVHGHTPVEKVENLPWRIGVDIGAYATGKLACVRLVENSRMILQI